MRNEAPFRVLAEGPFDPDAVRTIWVEPPVVPLELDERVRIAWQRALRSTEGKRLFDGRVAGLRGFRVEPPSSLLLELFPLSYRYVWFAYSESRCGRAEMVGHLPRALGISAVVLRAGEVVLMLRSWRVAEYPGAYDVFGGHIEPLAEGRWPSPVEALFAELEEELGYIRNQIAVRRCLGLLKAEPSGKPELVYEVEAVGAPDGPLARNEEVAEVVMLGESGELEAFLRREGSRFSPSALGSLELWLRVQEKSRAGVGD